MLGWLSPIQGVDRPYQGDVQMSELVQLLDISQDLSVAPPRFAYTLLISACNRAHEYQMVNELKAFGAMLMLKAAEFWSFGYDCHSQRIFLFGDATCW